MNSLEFELGCDNEFLYKLTEETEIVEDTWSLSISRMQQDQLNDNEFQKDLKILMKCQPQKYTKKEIDGVKLIHKHDRILVLKGSQQHILDWYHKILCHPGIIRQEQTIRSVFTWKNMQKISNYNANTVTYVK